MIGSNNVIPPSECIRNSRGRATPSAIPSDLGEIVGTSAQRPWLEATVVSRAKNKGKGKTKSPVGWEYMLEKMGLPHSQSVLVALASCLAKLRPKS